jgi:hypothetical protein
MKDPIEHLEAFYSECRTAEPGPAKQPAPPVRWIALAGAAGLGVAATLAVVLLTPRPSSDESAAARWIQESQVAQRAQQQGVEPWRG